MWLAILLKMELRCNFNVTILINIWCHTQRYFKVGLQIISVCSTEQGLKSIFMYFQCVYLNTNNESYFHFLIPKIFDITNIALPISMYNTYIHELILPWYISLKCWVGGTNLFHIVKHHLIKNFSPQHECCY